MKDEIYDNIVRKLGFKPEDYKPIYDHTENDRIKSQLSILSLEELQYLKKNNFFRKK